MTFFNHLSSFLIASVLLGVTWFVYLYVNDFLDKKLHQGVVLDISGIVLNFALLAAAGVIISTHALSFSAGVLIVAVCTGLYFSIRKLLSPKAV